MKNITCTQNTFLSAWVILITVTLCACQPIHQGASYNQNLGVRPGDSAPSGNGDILVLEKTRTASVIRSERYLATLVSCLGTNKATQRAKQAWQENKGSLSEDGSANSITAPMLSAMSKISSEVCLDLISQERGIASDNRRIFPQIDFSRGPKDIHVGQVRDSIRRLARSCWGRNETPEELLKLETASMTAFSNGGFDSQKTIDQMVYLCSAMTSSFSTFEM